MKKLIIVLFLFCAGCGSGEKLVEIHHVQQSTLDKFQPNVAAYAVWSSDDPYDKCDIYILPKDEYATEDWYHLYLGHELRHCFEGNYHE